MNVQLLKQMVLVERLPAKHAAKEQVLGELKRSLAGEAGERRTLELLKRELDLDGEPLILKDISLPYLNGHVQIDLLVVHKSLLCVLEVKNMIGEFYFDSDNFQFHRMVDGRLEGMRNPEAQLHRAVKAAEKYFSAQVHGVIVLSSRSGKVAAAPKMYPVIALDYLPFHLEKLAGSGLLSGLEDKVAKLSALPRFHYRTDLLVRHGLSKESIRHGVICQGCRNRPLLWKGRKWRCESCGFISNDAHEFALQEYAVLFGNELSTQFAYRWLGVEDKYVLYRLLEKSALQSGRRGKRHIVENQEILIAYFEGIYS